MSVKLFVHIFHIFCLFSCINVYTLTISCSYKPYILIHAIHSVCLSEVMIDDRVCSDADGGAVVPFCQPFNVRVTFTNSSGSVFIHFYIN